MQQLERSEIFAVGQDQLERLASSIIVLHAALDRPRAMAHGDTQLHVFEAVGPPQQVSNLLVVPPFAVVVLLNPNRQLIVGRIDVTRRFELRESRNRIARLQRHVGGLCEEFGLAFALVQPGTLFEHMGGIGRPFSGLIALGRLLEHLVLAQQFRGFGKGVASRTGVAHRLPQSTELLEQVALDRVVGDIGQVVADDLSGGIESVRALIKVDGGIDGRLIPRRQRRDAPPRLGGAAGVRPFLGMQLRELFLERDLRLDVRLVHRLLLEHRREFVPALLLLQQTKQLVARLLVGAVDLANLFPRSDRCFEVAQFVLTKPRYVAELRFAGVDRLRAIARRSHEHVAKFVELASLAQEVLDPAERLRVGGLLFEHGQIQVVRLRLAPLLGGVVGLCQQICNRWRPGWGRNRLLGGWLARERLAGDRLAGDRLAGDRLAGDRLAGDRLAGSGSGPRNRHRIRDRGRRDRTRDRRHRTGP